MQRWVNRLRGDLLDRVKSLQQGTTIEQMDRYRKAMAAQYDAFRREREEWQKCMDEQRKTLQTETKQLKQLRADMRRKNGALKNALATVEGQRDALVSLLKKDGNA